MRKRPLLVIGIATGIVIAIIIALTLLLVPENTHPAYAAATEFANAVGKGDDSTAFALLSDEMQAYVTQNCPGGSASACIDAYTPPEWGDMLSAVYRRSIPEGRDWHVLLVATYEEDKGFAGVCLYHRMGEAAPDDWRVMAWSGFVACDDPASGLQNLRQADAPNRVP